VTARIHLVRHCAHAEVGRVLTGRSTGAPLTATGCAQARWLAGWFARHGPVAEIHASPRLRARETANAIGARLGVEVEVVDALDEIDFGHWTGRSFAELHSDPAWTAWNTQLATARVPGGESMSEAVARAVVHVDRLCAREWPGAVLCVSHCDIIKGVIAHYLGLGLDRLLKFDIDPGSISTLLVGDWGGRVLTLNRESR
jgi:broad specificity phosphatase PhoE